MEVSPDTELKTEEKEHSSIMLMQNYKRRKSAFISLEDMDSKTTLELSKVQSKDHIEMAKSITPNRQRHKSFLID